MTLLALDEETDASEARLFISSLDDAIIRRMPLEQVAENQDELCMPRENSLQDVEVPKVRDCWSFVFTFIEFSEHRICNGRHGVVERPRDDEPSLGER